jgi:ectoine hydroxylase
MADFVVNDEQVAAFDRDGYLIVRGLYSPDEVQLLHRIARADMEHNKQAHAAKDADGRESKLWLTDDTDKADIYNAICHGRRMVETMARLLGDEVYLYHYKMMLKEPRVGGAWEWHQDYGYWYSNNCLFPHMGSCMIAVDRASKANGCLQVIPGSHKMGRIEHGTFGTQTGADPDRVQLALEHMELVYAEMDPGDALFFHSNTLHRSDANTSDDPRWTLICCYNTRHNPCDNKGGHPTYTPLEIWDDAKVLEIGQAQLNSSA